MSQERSQETAERDKSTRTIIPKQRALIFQGGGALGAYEAGVYRVLHDWIYKNFIAGKKNENFFDIIAGTSIGAINGAIVVSYVLKNKREVEQRRKQGDNEPRNWPEYWYGSADALEDFWNSLPLDNFFMNWYDLGFWPWDFFHVATKTMKEGWDEILDRSEESMINVWKGNNNNNPFVKEWFDFLRFHTEAWDIPASTEAARRHWSTMTFASPNVARAIPRNDLKFWDPRDFRFRGEQRQVPFYWKYPNYSLREACRGYILDSIKTDPKQKEPRLLFVTVDVQSGDTVSFDSYDTRTKYDEYDENVDQKKEDKDRKDEEYTHLIRYPEGIEWDQLSTTFCMADLYRYATLEDKSMAHEKGERKRTYWDGGVSSNTPLRELISKYKEYWSHNIEEERHEEIWDGEKGTKLPALDVYITDVWPAKITDYPVPSDNDFVMSRKGNLLLMDKTEYEESVTKMITHYMHLVESLLKTLNGKDNAATKAILNLPIIDNAFNKRGIKTYRDLLKGNFDIDRVMRIERKDDTYAVGLAMADFSAHTIRQLMASGKWDALDKLINTLSSTLENLEEKVPSDMRKSLHKHLKEARDSLGGKMNDHYSYDKVMKHLYDFVDEANMMETRFGIDSKVVGKNNSKKVVDLLRP